MVFIHYIIIVPDNCFHLFDNSISDNNVLQLVERGHLHIKAFLKERGDWHIKTFFHLLLRVA